MFLLPRVSFYTSFLCSTQVCHPELRWKVIRFSYVCFTFCVWIPPFATASNYIFFLRFVFYSQSIDQRRHHSPNALAASLVFKWKNQCLSKSYEFKSRAVGCNEKLIMYNFFLYIYLVFRIHKYNFCLLIFSNCRKRIVLITAKRWKTYWLISFYFYYICVMKRIYTEIYLMHI